MSAAPDAHQAAMEGAAEPPFHEELAEVWGANFGAHDEVGPLRRVMVRTPGEELAAIRADAWDEASGPACASWSPNRPTAPQPANDWPPWPRPSTASNCRR